MSDPQPRPATHEDLIALPPNQVGELIAGVLYSHVPAGWIAYARCRSTPMRVSPTCG